jgi:polo-like kinase 1
MMELMKKKQVLTELEAQYFMYQILLAVQYMHHERVIHRDLKLGNLFLDKNMEIKIGDFGLAAQLEFDDERKKTICGTPNYIAPEILNNKGHSYEVDIWSVGVILYTLLVGKPPFETNTVKDTYKKIRENSYSFPLTRTISEKAKRFIRKMLDPNPELRPTVVEALQDQYFDSLRNGERDPYECPSSLIDYANACMEKLNKPKIVQQSVEGTPLTRIPLRSLTKNLMNCITGSQASSPNPPKSARGTELITLKKTASSNPTRELLKLVPKVNTPGANLALIPSTISSTKKQANSHNADDLVDMHTNLSNITPRKDDNVSQNRISFTSIVHFVKYEDYGTAYRLNNGDTGVYFNDATKMIFLPSNGVVMYVSLPSKDDHTGNNDRKSWYHIQRLPDDLAKKGRLLMSFKDRLDVELNVENSDISIDSMTPDTTKDRVYATKVIPTKQGTFFRLSDRTVQVIFVDKTVIQISEAGQVVTFTNKLGETTSYNLHTTLVTSIPDLHKRLAFTKDLIGQIVKSK